MGMFARPCLETTWFYQKGIRSIWMSPTTKRRKWSAQRRDGWAAQTAAVSTKKEDQSASSYNQEADGKPRCELPLTHFLEEEAEAGGEHARRPTPASCVGLPSRWLLIGELLASDLLMVPVWDQHEMFRAARQDN